jgi:hypothetical protein
MRINSPTPSDIDGDERIARDQALRRYSVRNVPASSRLTPSVVCVRSLVPKEKEFRGLRDFGGAQRRARQFDHGADQIGGTLPFPLFDRVGDAAMRDFSMSSSLLKPTSGIMISSCTGLPPACFHIERRFENGARLHLVDFRIGDAEPARRDGRAWDWIRAARCARRSFAGSPPARATSAISSSFCGRNSCKGGSSRRMVTGSPSIALKIARNRCAAWARAWQAPLCGRRPHRPGSSGARR